ncbi:MAG: repeat containing protein [Candidatus Eremiobacteraeota bacterium]|nr:repeat containing protein [Candidatus Eremiobacteraeota bacterium]
MIQPIPVLTKHVVAYLANRISNVVNVYYDETATPAYVITVPSTATGLAVDSQGTVIVPMGPSGVALYENGATAAPTYTLTSGIGYANNACTDREGNIYVTDNSGNGGNGQVEMFVAGGQNTVAATYTAGMGGPFACAIDPADDSLWVVNIGTSTVVQFAHGSTAPQTQFGLTGGINNADEGIALDRFGTMYIGLNDQTNAPQVQVYLNGSHSANFTFNTYNSGGVVNVPTGVQVDVAGNLWVGTYENAQGGAVQKFPGYVNASSLPMTLPYSGVGGMIGFAVTPTQ